MSDEHSLHDIPKKIIDRICLAEYWPILSNTLLGQEKMSDVSDTNFFEKFAPEGYSVAIKAFSKHMPPKEQSELSILKGHLLIEQVLDKMISDNLCKTNEIHNAQLTFHQKMILAKSMVDYEEEEEWIWVSIGKFNSVRNRLAHRLEDPGFDDKLRDFISSVWESVGESPEAASTDVYGELNEVIFDLHQSISWLASWE